MPYYVTSILAGSVLDKFSGAKIRHAIMGYGSCTRSRERFQGFIHGIGVNTGAVH